MSNPWTSAPEVRLGEENFEMSYVALLIFPGQGGIPLPPLSKSATDSNKYLTLCRGRRPLVRRQTVEMESVKFNFMPSLQKERDYQVQTLLMILRQTIIMMTMLTIKIIMMIIITIIIIMF